MKGPKLTGLTKGRLDEVIDCVKKALSEEKLRRLSQRAVQAKIWHLQQPVSLLMSDLRKEEEIVRNHIMQIVSKLLYSFHEHSLETTLARAGVIRDSRIHAGSSLQAKNKEFVIFCLDSKERLYLTIIIRTLSHRFFRLRLVPAS